MEALQIALPQYHITGLLGCGGMGAVYGGMQPTLERTVAVKILPSALSDPSLSERFRTEALAMAKLNHPGIVKVFDSGQTADGLLYLIMEFVEGGDVLKLLEEQGGRLRPQDALAVTAHICDALHYAHERGILHRDIKPANIMLTAEGALKIADFGLAKITRHQPDGGLTQSGMGMGTLAYMAPESLILGAGVDRRADIYAVGVMLYQMLTGKLPRGIFEKPSALVSGLDERLDLVVHKALMDDRDLRYATTAELREALDEVLTRPVVKKQAPTSAAPAQTTPPATDQETRSQPARLPTVPAPDKKPVLLVLVAFIISFVAGLGLLEFRRKHMTVAAEQGAQAAVLSPPPAAAPSGTSGPDSPALKSSPPTTASVASTPQSATVPKSAPVLMQVVSRPATPCTIKVWKHGPSSTPMTPAEQPEAFPPADLKDVVMLALGLAPAHPDRHCVVLRSDGSVVVWGGNSAGQCDVPLGLADAVAVAAGDRFTAVLKQGGSVLAWGMAYKWPMKIPEIQEKVVNIVAGRCNLIMLTEYGRVFVAGDEGTMKSGEMSLPAPAVAVGAHLHHAVALLDDGRLWQWGKRHPVKGSARGLSAGALPWRPHKTGWQPASHVYVRRTIPMAHQFILTPDGMALDLMDDADKAAISVQADYEAVPLDRMTSVRQLESESFRRCAALTATGWVVWGGYAPPRITWTSVNLSDCIGMKYSDHFCFGLVPVRETVPVNPASIASAAVVALPQAPPGIAPPPELAALIAAFRTQMSDLVTRPHISNHTALSANYIRALQAREQKARSQSNTFLQKIYQDEIASATRHQPIGQADERGLHPDLALLRTTWHQEVASLEKARDIARSGIQLRLAGDLEKLAASISSSRLAEAAHLRTLIVALELPGGLEQVLSLPSEP